MLQEAVSLSTESQRKEEMVLNRQILWWAVYHQSLPLECECWEGGDSVILFITVSPQPEEGLLHNRCFKLSNEWLNQLISPRTFRPQWELGRFEYLHPQTAISAASSGIPNSSGENFYFLLPWELFVKSSCHKLRFNSRSVLGVKGNRRPPNP